MWDIKALFCGVGVSMGQKVMGSPLTLSLCQLPFQKHTLRHYPHVDEKVPQCDFVKGKSFLQTEGQPGSNVMHYPFPSLGLFLAVLRATDSDPHMYHCDLVEYLCHLYPETKQNKLVPGILTPNPKFLSNFCLIISAKQAGLCHPILQDPLPGV